PPGRQTPVASTVVISAITNLNRVNLSKNKPHRMKSHSKWLAVLRSCHRRCFRNEVSECPERVTFRKTDRVTRRANFVATSIFIKFAELAQQPRAQGVIAGHFRSGLILVATHDRLIG